MPRLSELTDYYSYDPMGNAVPALPVEDPFPDLKKVYITGEKELPVKFSEEPKPPAESSPLSNNVDKILNSIFRSDEKRLQLWPERLVRSGITAAGDVYSGKVPTFAIDPATGDVHTSPEMIEKAQEIAALAGTGGFGSGGGSLNATPSLRPALKHKERLYKGKLGQEHQDIIPDSLYNDFQKKAMSGQDLAEYNFGFLNDKGHFLTREQALDYGIANGLIDPQAGKFGTLTSTMFSDSSKPGVAIEAMKTANPFFSALEHNVKGISQSKMTGDQWLGTLSNKPGVKPEELDWTGLRSFLEENKGKPVTKAQIESHLAENKIELGEVVKKSRDIKNIPQSELDDVANELYGKNFNDLPNGQKLSIKQQIGGIDTTKYKNYQLPGGENYRELLMTMPQKQLSEAEARQVLGAKPDAKLSAADIEYASRKNAAEYKSSHWDEPNILAHVRMNDRTIDGKKSLHIEEIQSDWHQQGRDKGYRGDNEKKLADLVSKRDSMLSEVRKLSPLNDRYKEIYKELPEIQEQINQLGRSDVGVPDAPFKKNWHELALKRALREAAEKGYDRLSWTPGEAQAARYDLSKQISDMKVLRSIDGKGYTIYATMKGRGSDRTRLADNIPPEKLADTVGKEMADKIKKDIDAAQYNVWGVKNKASGNWSQRFGLKKEAEAYQQSLPESVRGKTEVLEMAPKYAAEYSGLDLKVGGEGMKGFYDQIIPKALEKLGKEHGVKVQKGGVGRKYYEVIDDKGKVHFTFPNEQVATELAKANNMKSRVVHENNVYYIDIPQSLRDTATQKGFPLFSAGGYMLMPVAGNPFEGNK